MLKVENEGDAEMPDEPSDSDSEDSNRENHPDHDYPDEEDDYEDYESSRWSRVKNIWDGDRNQGYRMNGEDGIVHSDSEEEGHYY